MRIIGRTCWVQQLPVVEPSRTHFKKKSHLATAWLMPRQETAKRSVAATNCPVGAKMMMEEMLKQAYTPNIFSVSFRQTSQS